MTDMFKCHECGLVFHVTEFKVVHESRGEFWGVPCYEDMYYCPNCSSEACEEYDEDLETEENENDELD